VVSHLPPGHQASGTKSSTAFSPSSVRTGAPSRFVSYRVIVELISATTTKTGLTVRC